MLISRSNLFCKKNFVQTRLKHKCIVLIHHRKISTRNVDTEDAKLIEKWKNEVSKVREINSQTIDVGPLKGLTQVLDSPGEVSYTNWKNGDNVPGGWHLVFFNNYQIPGFLKSGYDLTTIEPELSPDGYEATFSPPPPFLHRMWANSSIDFNNNNPLKVGQNSTVETRCSSVDYKRSASRGDIVFVELERKVNNEQGLVLTEKRKLAYFKQKGDPSKATKLPVPEKSDFSRIINPTEVKLFRYSALTYNCHRIHYDNDYATKVEGYPGILVHGPLTATFLIDLVARNNKFPAKNFNYKATSPLFANQPFAIHGKEEEKGKFSVWATTPDGGLAMTGTVTV